MAADAGIAKLPEILTDNLRLTARDPAETLAAIAAMSEADRAQVSPEWLARAKAATSADPWTHGFALAHRETGKPVGSCGFKGPPDADGMVEIAYGIDEAYRGQGYATEAARALSAYAFGTGQVRVVRAHTLPNENASTRVLAKCGFERIGEVIDPEDGLVWRFELRRSATRRRVIFNASAGIVGLSLASVLIAPKALALAAGNMEVLGTGAVANLALVFGSLMFLREAMRNRRAND
jgi:ribosomal-protein-alanine N-acetyltransferase